MKGAGQAGMRSMVQKKRIQSSRSKHFKIADNFSRPIDYHDESMKFSNFWACVESSLLIRNIPTNTKFMTNQNYVRIDYDKVSIFNLRTKNYFLK